MGSVCRPGKLGGGRALVSASGPDPARPRRWLQQPRQYLQTAGKCPRRDRVLPARHRPEARQRQRHEQSFRCVGRPETVRRSDRLRNCPGNLARFSRRPSQPGKCSARPGPCREAIACFQEALSRNPTSAETCNALDVPGPASRAWKRRSNASTEPSSSTPPSRRLNNCGTALANLGRLDDAVAYFQQATGRMPGYAEAWNNLGNTWKAQGRLEDAIACYLCALEIRADYPHAHSNLLLVSFSIARAQGLPNCAVHAEFDQRVAEPLRAAARRANSREPDRKLRLGLVSADFGEHPVGYFLVSPWKTSTARSPSRSATPTGSCRTNDRRGSRLAATSWRDACDLADERLADADPRRPHRHPVRPGRPYGREPPAGLRPQAGPDPDHLDRATSAPPGWRPWTTCWPTATQVPPGAEPYYREQVLRMPDGYVCFVRRRAPRRSARCRLPAPDRVTFGSFNNPAKITPEWSPCGRNSCGACCRPGSC